MGSTTPHDDRLAPPTTDTVPVPADAAGTPCPAGQVVPLRRPAKARLPAPPDDDDDPGPQAA